MVVEARSVADEKKGLQGTVAQPLFEGQACILRQYRRRPAGASPQKKVEAARAQTITRHAEPPLRNKNELIGRNNYIQPRSSMALTTRAMATM